MRNLSQAHWRDSARSVRFFMLDGKSVFPFLLFLLHIRLWTFVVALVAIIFFAFLNRFGFTVDVFGRWLRSSIAGRRKVACAWWEE